jgi:crotonobetainyl-CoA:carnitine CoA-transferase CaiB-like acyl-CoA transferase
VRKPDRDWKARANVDISDPGRPLFTSLPIASTTAAILGAFRVVAALLQRNQAGRGGWVEVPLAEAMLQVIGFHLEFPDFVEARVDLPRPFPGSYRCADDRFVDQVSYPRFVERFLKAAGVWDSWREAGLSDLTAVFADPDLRRVRVAGSWTGRRPREVSLVCLGGQRPFASHRRLSLSDG